MRSLFICAALLLGPALWAQGPYKVHSHNDYAQQVPFWLAYSGGAASIEVDLFYERDSLFVTHEKAEIQAGKTLEKLYLDPLDGLQKSGALREIQLLIDLKSEAYATLDPLVTALRGYPNLLQGKMVKFIISGSRPVPGDYGKYPEFIQFDHQNLGDLDQIDLAKVALVSVNFKDFTVWNGYGRMVEAERRAVEAAIQKAKASGKPFRFWASPDTKTAWARLAQLGVDFINTDRPARAKAYLDLLDKNTFTLESPQETYRPKFAHKSKSRPKNVILMIGDGNGLAQISATMIANRGKLTLGHLRNLGLINTSSADDLITDSAAAGTALATGIKTNNRAIGQGPGGQDLHTLVEALGTQGFNTAIVTTDAIFGATPASFFANRTERDDTPGLVADLVDSGLDFFIAGGKGQEEKIKGTFVTKTLDGLGDLDQRTAVYLGEEKAPSMERGRGDALPQGVKKALEVLGSDKAPFLLVVEAAQIDNGGHANNTSGIIREMLDFDRAIAEALKFADADGNTLVVITADHETSGFGIVGGDRAQGTVQGDFLTVDHSAIMVPLFAYGPQAESFNGIYENTAVFSKILEALKIR